MSADLDPTPKQSRKRGWASPEVLLLGALSLLGLIGFVIAFGLVMTRTTSVPQAAITGAAVPGEVRPAETQTAARQGPPGERGPAGPPGPRGAAGDAGIRIVRIPCGGGDCTARCEPGELLLTAHCGAGRAQAMYPTESTALCRSRSNVRVEIVAACVKTAH